MVDDEDYTETVPFSLEHVSVIIKNYRVPILLGVGGVALIVISLLLTLPRGSSSPITFTEHSSTPSATTKVMVDIEGEVMAPGVYQLTMGSRIDDLIIMAGGLTSSADRVWIAKHVNKAMQLTDGGKLYIPSSDDNITNTTGSTVKENTVLGAADSLSTEGKININNASISELDRLPSVGQVTAQKIINGRPYQSIDELTSKKIVGKAVFEKIKDLVVVY